MGFAGPGLWSHVDFHASSSAAVMLADHPVLEETLADQCHYTETGDEQAIHSPEADVAKLGRQ